MTDADSRRILLVESYGAGSHIRIARLLQQHSRHRIDIVCLARDHWRTIAFTGHRVIRNALQALDPQPYHLIVFSGPADFRRALSDLTPQWREIPRVAYFHESQWTYPAVSLDRIPHLVNHLETLEFCDAAWFNSRFHRDTFKSSAMNHPARAVQNLAREILPRHWHKSAVAHPPVEVTERPIHRSSQVTISWAARWEQEKRPDRLLDTVRACLELGLDLKLHILGCDPDRWREDPAMDAALLDVVDPASGFLCRDQYESVLAASDVWLSTAEHEYFGVAAIEAAMLGAAPVVPAGLAYPETLPSALMYPAGRPEAASQCILAVAQARRPLLGAWRVDANRFHTTKSVERFDLGILKLLA